MNFAELQAAIPPIKHNRKGYNYTYADLPEILRTVAPVLKKAGAAICHRMEDVDGDHLLVTELVGGGDEISDLCKTRIPKTDDPQELGKWVTYLRRYHVCCMLGISAEEDTDASGVGKGKAAGKPAVKAVPRGPLANTGGDFS